jgi:hypothetical protein
MKNGSSSDRAPRCAWVAAAAALVLAIASCTPRAAQSSDSSPPRLIRCPTVVIPSGSTRIYVSLRFTVGIDGAVDPASVRWIPAGARRRPTDREIDEATRLAVACAFEPARRGLEAVAADFERTFSIVR